MDSESELLRTGIQNGSQAKKNSATSWLKTII